MEKTVISILMAFAGCAVVFAQAPSGLKQCNVVWDRQSKNSGGSMPCGGSGLGLNVWVEKGELLIYGQLTGSFGRRPG